MEQRKNATFTLKIHHIIKKHYQLYKGIQHWENWNNKNIRRSLRNMKIKLKYQLIKNFL